MLEEWNIGFRPCYPTNRLFHCSIPLFHYSNIPLLPPMFLRRNKILWLIVSLAFFHNEVLAQHKSWGFSAAYHLGFLATHNPTMLHLVDGHVQGVEATIFRQTNGESSWQQAYQNPQTGLNFIYLDLPSDTILGEALAAMAFLDMPLLKSDAYRFSIRASCGIGYLSHHFERVENHKNSAIGSALNAAIQVTFKNSILISSRLEYTLSAGLTHFSNGSFNTPNLGLNNITLNSGLSYLVSMPDTFYRRQLDPPNKKWYTEMVLAGGAKEIYPPDNGKYFSASLIVNRKHRVSQKSGIGFGADVFYDAALNTLIEIQEKVPSDVVPIRAGVHFSYELLISRVSALFDYGLYVVDPYGGQGWQYHRIGLRYSLNENLLLNLSMKTHFAKAEYVEWGLGWKFGRN